jgi:hypothetical protein
VLGPDLTSRRSVSSSRGGRARTTSSRRTWQKIAFGDECWWQTIAVDNHTGALDFLHDDREARKSFGQGFVDAVQAARSARFERGSGGVRPSPLENHEA